MVHPHAHYDSPGATAISTVGNAENETFLGKKKGKVNKKNYNILKERLSVADNEITVFYYYIQMHCEVKSGSTSYQHQGTCCIFHYL